MGDLYQGSQPAGSFADLYNDSIPQSYHPVVLVANYEFIPYNLTDYPVILVTNTGTEEGIRIEQTGILASDRAALYVTSTTAQITGIAFAYLYAANAASSIPLLKLENKGTGAPINIVKNITSVAANEGDLVYDGTHLWFKGSGVAKDLIALAAGGVTQISAGAGMDFPVITDNGSIVLGTPSDISATSANSANSTTHTHRADSTIVKTNGSYTDPSWIVHLPESKVLAAQTGHNGQFYKSDGANGDWADAVTSIVAGNGLDFSTITTTGTVTMGTPGSITSTSTNAVGTATHTHAIDSTIINSGGTYADPSWITSLAESKTLPAQAGKVGYWLQTDGTNTSWQAIPSDSDTLQIVTTRGAFTSTHSYFYNGIQVGVTDALGITGYINFAGITSGTVTVKVADEAGTWTLTLPTDDGTPGQVLQTNGSGVTSWATVTTSPAGNDTYVQYNDGGAFGGDSTFYFNDTSKVLTASYVGTQGIQFNTSPTITPTLGQLYWDTTDGTLAVNIDVVNGVTLSLGHEMYLKAVNKTGSQIADGKAVYLYPGAQGNRPKIALAQADDYATALMVGVATQNIADDNEGVVTTYGVVHGFNTSGFTAGDTLYLDPDNAGGIINTIPTTPDYVVIIGKALNSTNNGSILVNPRMPLATDASMAADTSLVAPTQKAVKSALAGKQDSNSNLTSLAGLAYASAAFVKMTGANTFTLDTNTYLTSLSGAVLTDQTSGQTIGDTTNRLTKLWATDITVTNAITGSVTGNAGTVTGLSVTAGQTLTVTTGGTINTGAYATIANYAPLATPAFTSSISVGVASGATGSVIFNGTTSGVVTINVKDAAGTWTLTLPDNDGDNLQFLQTNGSGVTTWATVDLSTYLPLSGGTLTGNLLFTDNSLSIGATGGTSPQYAYLTNSLYLGRASVATGSINFRGTTSGVVTLKTADAAGTWSMTLPATAGSNTNILQTDGNGVTSWVDKPAGTVTAVSVATANGVSGSSSGGATPALTISLGAITPSKVTIDIKDATASTDGIYFAQIENVAQSYEKHAIKIGTVSNKNNGYIATGVGISGFHVDYVRSAATDSTAYTAGYSIKYCGANAASGSSGYYIYGIGENNITAGIHYGLNIAQLAAGNCSGATITGIRIGQLCSSIGASLGTLKYLSFSTGVSGMQFGSVALAGDLCEIVIDRYKSSTGSPTDSYNVFKISDTNRQDSSGTYTVSGDTFSIATLTSNSVGTLNHSKNVLKLTQSSSGTTGALIRGVVGSTERFTVCPMVANSGTNIAYLFDTTTSLSGTTKIASFSNAGSEKAYLNNAGAWVTVGAVLPSASDGAALGSTSLMWSDLFLASGAVINFNNGNYTLTHAAGILTASSALTVSGNLTSSAGRIVARTTVSDADKTAATGEFIIAYTTLSASRTVTLPDALRANGREFVIKDETGSAATYNIILDPEGATTIDGAATYTMNVNYESVTVYSDGTNWFTR